MRLDLVRGVLGCAHSSVVTFGIGVMLLLAGRGIAEGTFTVGDFALFVSYLWFTTQVPSEIGTFYGDYKTQEVSIDRLLDMVRPEPPARLVERIPYYEHKAFDRGVLPEVPFTRAAPSTAWSGWKCAV